jgi:hypothetical protein
MRDSTPSGDQPRASSKQVSDAGREPSLSYRATPIKSYAPRQARKPSRS